MKIRVITEVSIWKYCTKNARAIPSFHIFLERIKKCDWNDLNDIKADFPNVSIIGNCENDRIVFDVGGNNYRMICDYNFYMNCCLYVAFIGTHAEYDKVDACTVQMY
jgi:mRNA interferase HigB